MDSVLAAIRDLIAEYDTRATTFGILFLTIQSGEPASEVVNGFFEAAGNPRNESLTDEQAEATVEALLFANRVALEQLRFLEIVAANGGEM